MRWQPRLEHYRKKRGVNPYPGPGKTRCLRLHLPLLRLLLFFFFFLKEGDIFSNLAVKKKGR